MACIKQSTLPFGEGRGGGFETGSWLVACSSWKTRNKPTCMALSIQTNYHALRTTHHEPSFPHAPPPTSRLTTPLRPAVTYPGGGGETSKRLVAHGNTVASQLAAPDSKSHHVLRTTHRLLPPTPRKLTLCAPAPYSKGRTRAGMAELVDAVDSKSTGREAVRVRVPLPAPARLGG